MAVSTILLLTGCSETDKRHWHYQAPKDNYRLALEGTNADQRRDAVTRIAESNYVTDQTAFHVLDAVARTDSVSQIRCIAIKAFARYGDDRPVETLLAILQATPGSDKSLAPDEHVRWEAASALLAFEYKGLVKGDQRDTARELFIKMAAPESPKTVRIVGTQALGRFQHRNVLNPLVANLRDEDFAIADRAERSLIALTGTTHDYDADAWDKWLAATPEPFAHAGQKPISTRPAGPSWWDKQKRVWRQTLKLGND